MDIYNNDSFINDISIQNWSNSCQNDTNHKFDDFLSFKIKSTCYGSQWAETHFLWTFGHNSVKNNVMIVVEGSLEAYCCAGYNKIKNSQFQVVWGQITIFGQYGPEQCF